MSESPTSSWRDWTRTGGESGEGFEERIAKLEKWTRTHLGIDFQSSGIDYPHPSQKVRSLYFFEGNGRLDPTGIQILTTENIQRGIFWVDQFTDSPNDALPKLSVTGVTNGTVYRLLLESDYDATYQAAITAYSSPTASYGRIAARAGSDIAELIFLPRTGSDFHATLNLQSALGAVIQPAGLPGDPTNLVNGQLFWRTDTDRYRVRLGGVTYNLATTADIPAVPTTMNKVPFAAKTTTYTTTNADGTITVDATSASFTVTLVTASGNAGLVQTFKKITAANTVTIDGSGAETLDGLLSYGLSAMWSWVQVTSDGSNWIITGAG